MVPEKQFSRDQTRTEVVQAQMIVKLGTKYCELHHIRKEDMVWRATGHMKDSNLYANREIVCIRGEVSTSLLRRRQKR